MLTQLDPTEEELSRARTGLLDLLERQETGSAPCALAREILGLDPTAGELRRARTVLLELLERLDSHEASQAARVRQSLEPNPDDLCRARTALLALFPRETFDGIALGVAVPTELEHGIELAREIVHLDPRPEDLRHLCEVIIAQLLYRVASRVPQPEEITESEACITSLTPTPSEKKHGLGILLRGVAALTGQESGESVAIDLAPIVMRLTCTAQDRERP